MKLNGQRLGIPELIVIVLFCGMLPLLVAMGPWKQYPEPPEARLWPVPDQAAADESEACGGDFMCIVDRQNAQATAHALPPPVCHEDETGHFITDRECLRFLLSPATPGPAGPSVCNGGDSFAERMMSCSPSSSTLAFADEPQEEDCGGGSVSIELSCLERQPVTSEAYAQGYGRPYVSRGAYVDPGGTRCTWWVDWDEDPNMQHIRCYDITHINPGTMVIYDCKIDKIMNSYWCHDEFGRNWSGSQQ